MRKTMVMFISLALVLSVVAPIGIVVFTSAAQPEENSLSMEKRIFIHYKKGFGKPDGTPGKGPPPKDGNDDGYYALLGVKWKKLPVSYVIDPDNPQGLTEEFIVNAIVLSAEEWDTHTSAELFSNDYTIDYEASWDSDTPDGRNEIVFDDYPQNGVIAVTVVWGYFSGPRGRREIIEFDIVFDIDFTWGDAVSDPTVMDLQNIATHEFGHSVGLADLYQEVADQETMYGFATSGETIKRDAYVGDIAGIQELYG